MDAPDFTKYDEAQLRQVLTRIDRERFPERVALIETLLNEIAGDDSPSGSKLGPRKLSRKLGDSSNFVVKPYPGAVKRVFDPALPFIVIGTIAIGAAALFESTSHRSMLGIAGPVGMIAIFTALGITSYRLSTLICPTCKNECKKTILENRNWGAICNRCEIQWDTGISSDD